MSRQSENPTLQDIAAAAGVSTATVSRVLNQPASVSEKLRVRVEAEVVKLGYVRHGAARALASSRAYTVGAVIPTLESAIFATGVNAIESRLDAEGLTLLLAVTNYDRTHEFRQVRNLLEHGVDGIILVGSDHDEKVFDLLEQQGCPFVNTWTHDEASRHPCVGFDNVTAASRITEYLIGLGHIRIGMIAGIQAGNDRARDRVAGVRQALNRAGLDLAPIDLVERPYELAAGRDGFIRLLGRPPQNRPTAIVCGNDVLALAAMIEAGGMGVQVPEDISITGFDDLPFCEHLPPGLTTVHVPSRQMGTFAAEYILDRIAGRPSAMRVELPTQLMIRGTAAAPRR
ncbi:MAG: substrate-binding domain-containing protein [Proteobacteria bacterium]|nr:substrate-binding domain-containing protein [Pseudomonadota bacterium]